MHDAEVSLTASLPITVLGLGNGTVAVGQTLANRQVYAIKIMPTLQCSRGQCISDHAEDKEDTAYCQIAFNHTAQHIEQLNLPL